MKADGKNKTGKAIKQFASKKLKIDLLVNNAGINIRAITSYYKMNNNITKTNRLANESSPYLLMNANNIVEP